MSIEFQIKEKSVNVLAPEKKIIMVPDVVVQNHKKECKEVHCPSHRN